MTTKRLTSPIHAGRKGRRWNRLRANLRMQRRPCWLCGQRIDYTAPAGDPNSFSADHMHPLSTHPHLAEDPANLQAAHLACNVARGTREPRPGLGDGSPQW